LISATLLFLAAFCLKGKVVRLKWQNFFRKKIVFIFGGKARKRRNALNAKQLWQMPSPNKKINQK